MKKYTLKYSSTTGYGWEAGYDRIDEFEDFIDEHKNNVYSRLWVFDNQLGKIIFSKPIFSNPTIDYLFDIKRDLRTATRKRGWAD